MKLVSYPLTSVPDTVVVDLSWRMYSNRYAMFNLGVVDTVTQSIIPTGHLHGTLMDIIHLSLMYPRVILAVDSICTYRSKIYSEYKADRKEKRKEEFPIRTHQPLLLAAASLIPNVYFVKEADYEADDLINHLIASGHNPILFAKDNDLMQINAPYRMAHRLTGGLLELLDTTAYLTEKYGVQLPFLPIWWKMVRGDPSDNLSPGAPRYPSKKLVQLCEYLSGTREFADFEKYITDTRDPKLLQAKATCFRNFQIVSPRPLGAPLLLKKVLDYPVESECLKLSLHSTLNLIYELAAKAAYSGRTTP